jgi:hypothetical protein
MISSARASTDGGIVEAERLDDASLTTVRLLELHRKQGKVHTLVCNAS